MSEPVSAERRRIMQGAALMVLATFGFVGMDSILKVLARQHDAVFLAWGRNLFQVGYLVLLMPFLGARRMIATRHPVIQFWRGAMLVLTTVFIVLALGRMPLAQTYSITFIAPALATILAIFVLGERPSPWRGLWIALGFAGVLVALRPGAPDAGLHLLFPLIMAAANAVYHVLTRAISADEDPLAMLFLMAFCALSLTSLALPWTWSPMTLPEWSMLALGGALGTLAHLLLITAFRLAPTSIVSPMIYSQIVAASIMGFFFFGEVPTVSTIVGSAIVIFSGVALIRTRS